jgi:simple sugar transport system permease protein
MSISARPAGSRRADFFARHAQVFSIAVFFCVCCAIFALSADAFLTRGNILNILRQSAPMLIVAVSMTFVITTGGIDLAVGSTVALINALAAILLQAGVPWPLVVLGLLLIGGCVGAIQGWFVAFQGIPAFIVTLAGLSMLRGVALLMTQGYSIPISSDSLFGEIGRGLLGGVPVPAIIAAVVAVLGVVTLNQTRFGRHVTAVGINAEAARRAGIATRAVIVSAYVLTGVAAAMAGIVIAARLSSGSSNAAVGFELDVIAAVVLGGTSLAGGRGTMIGTILGGLTIAVIGNGLILVAIWLNTRIFARLAAPGRKH